MHRATNTHLAGEPRGGGGAIQGGGSAGHRDDHVESEVGAAGVPRAGAAAGAEPPGWMGAQGHQWRELGYRQFVHAS